MVSSTSVRSWEQYLRNTDPGAKMLGDAKDWEELDAWGSITYGSDFPDPDVVAINAASCALTIEPEEESEEGGDDTEGGDEVNPEDVIQQFMQGLQPDQGDQEPSDEPGDEQIERRGGLAPTEEAHGLPFVALAAAARLELCEVTLVGHAAVRLDVERDDDSAVGAA